jgi:hypothetical protein
MLSNPLLNFDKLLFCKCAQPSYSHLVGQYFGWRQRPGGGLFVLEKAGGSLAVRDIVGSQLHLAPKGGLHAAVFFGGMS